MKNDRIFLREVNENCGEENFVLVSMRANFDKVQLCQTYGDYGQQVGCYNAGCYSLENSESTFKQDLESYITEKFQLAENFSYDDFAELDEDEADNGIKESIKTWIEENENHSSCVAYTYWDGNNFATAIIENEYFDDQVSHVEIDKEEAKLVEEAIENRSFVKEGFGKEIYEYGDYIVIDNYCQGHWESWQVIKKEHYVND